MRDFLGQLAASMAICWRLAGARRFRRHGRTGMSFQMHAGAVGASRRRSSVPGLQAIP